MTEELADKLERVKSNTEAERAEIVGLVETGRKIKVTCKLPSGTTFNDELDKPVEWKAENEFVSLMNHFGLEPNEVGELEGKEISIEKSTGRTELNFEIDKSEFLENSCSTEATHSV